MSIKLKTRSQDHYHCNYTIFYCWACGIWTINGLSIVMHNIYRIRSVRVLELNEAQYQTHNTLMILRHQLLCRFKELTQPGMEAVKPSYPKSILALYQQSNIFRLNEGILNLEWKPLSHPIPNQFSLFINNLISFALMKAYSTWNGSR